MEAGSLQQRGGSTCLTLVCTKQQESVTQSTETNPHGAAWDHGAGRLLGVRASLEATSTEETSTAQTQESNTTTRTSIQIDDLPNELILEILTRVDSKSILSTVPRVCRLWRALTPLVKDVCIDLSKFESLTPKLARTPSWMSKYSKSLPEFSLTQLDSLPLRERAVALVLPEWRIQPDFIVKLAEVCPHIATLDITQDVDENAIAAVAKACTLQTLRIRCSRYRYGWWAPKFADQCSSLTTLVLDNHKSSGLFPGDLDFLIRRCPSLTSFTVSHISEIRVDDVYTALAAHCPELTTLDVRARDLNGQAIADLAKKCRKLRSINLSGCFAVRDAAIEALAKYCPDLEAVSLAKCRKLTSAAVEKLAKSCRRLMTINLDHCTKVGDAAIASLAKYCPELREGHFWCTLPPSDAAVSSLATACHAIEVLDLCYGDVLTDDAVEIIAARCTSLRTLKVCAARRKPQFLPDGKLTDRSLLALVDSRCDKIRRVAFGGHLRITDAAVEALVHRFPRLTHVNFNHCDLTDRSVRAVATECYAVECVKFNGNNRITDAGVLALAERGPPLYFVAFKGCSLTETSGKAISRHYPTLRDSSGLPGRQGLRD